MRRPRLQCAQGVDGVCGAAALQLAIIHLHPGQMGKSPLRHGQTVPACAEAALFHPRLAGRDDVEHIQPQLRYRRLRQGHMCAVRRVESAAIQAYALLAVYVAWHLFFAAYAQALLSAEKYSRLLAIAKRYNLLALEKKFIDKTVYMPILLWHNEVALYMEGRQSKEKLEETIYSSASVLLQNKYKAGRINELLDILSITIPSEIAIIRSKLNLKPDRA